VIRFNLLPYRQQQQLVRRKHFFAQLAICAFATCAGLAATTWWTAMQIDRQGVRNDRLTQEQNTLSSELAEIARLEGEIQGLARRIDTIASLNTDRTLLSSLLNDLHDGIPHDASLVDFNLKYKTLEINGLASSNERLAQWLAKLAKLETLKSSSLKLVKQDASTLGAPTAVAKPANGSAPAQPGGGDVSVPQGPGARTFAILAQANRRGPDLNSTPNGAR
jgi:type IV pilus assembly protein PilN